MEMANLAVWRSGPSLVRASFLQRFNSSILASENDTAGKHIKSGSDSGLFCYFWKLEDVTWPVLWPQWTNQSRQLRVTARRGAVHKTPALDSWQSKTTINFLFVPRGQHNSILTCCTRHYKPDHNKTWPWQHLTITQPNHDLTMTRPNPVQTPDLVKMTGPITMWRRDHNKSWPWQDPTMTIPNHGDMYDKALPRQDLSMSPWNSDWPSHNKIWVLAP